jgi:enoyl-[acyl-carrier protein] reductase II
LNRVQQLEAQGAAREELLQLLGKGRARKGMFEGDTEAGELEIGQVAYMINSVEPVDKIISDLIREFNEVSEEMNGWTL